MYDLREGQDDDDERWSFGIYFFFQQYILFKTCSSEYPCV